jgi:hypothetical protein
MSKKETETLDITQEKQLPAKPIKYTKDGRVKKTTLKGDMTDEEFALAQKKRAELSVEARKKKTPLADLINLRFNDKERKKVVDAYIGYLTDNTIRIADRIKILELILKVTGELDNPKAMLELNQAENKIKLEFS